MDSFPKCGMPEAKKLAVEKYFTVEKKFMAAEGYSESKEAILRRKALCVIVEVSAVVCLIFVIFWFS